MYTDTDRLRDLIKALPYLVLNERPCKVDITQCIQSIDVLLFVLPLIKEAYLTGYDNGRREGLQYGEARFEELKRACSHKVMELEGRPPEVGRRIVKAHKVVTEKPDPGDPAFADIEAHFLEEA